MKRGLKSVKSQQWVDRLQRFQVLGQTAVDFCRDEGISLPSFYQWKRKLGQPVQPQQLSRTQRQFGSRGPNKKAGRALFRAVNLTGVDGMSSASGVVVRMPSGIAIELGRCPDTIERVIDQLLDHHAAEWRHHETKTPRRQMRVDRHSAGRGNGRGGANSPGNERSAVDRQPGGHRSGRGRHVELE